MMGEFKEFVDAKIMYWSPNKEDDYGKPYHPVQIGQPVPRSSNLQDRSMRALSDAFEAVRKEVNPSAPSRIGAIFLSPDIKSAKMWLEDKLFEVKVEGKYYITNAELWTEAAFRLPRPITSLDDVIKRVWAWASEYWSNPKYITIPEAIVDGNAKTIITREI